jgi:membrane fusion protein (multidrug efflux system)
MKKRQWAIMGGFLLLAFAIWLKNQLSQSVDEKAPPSITSIKAIRVDTVKNGSVPLNIKVDGPLEAQQKIDLFSEVNGVLSLQATKFDAGRIYRKGEVLLDLDDSEALSSYRALKSQYLNVLGQAIPDIKIDFPSHFDSWYKHLQSISAGNWAAAEKVQDQKLRLFLSARGLYSAYQNAESARIRLEKYQIRAPFDGVLTEALVEPGQLIRVGQKLGEFMGKGKFEMITSLSISEVPLVNIGDTVYLQSNGRDKEYQGIVYRKNAKIDPSTQRVSIFIILEDESLVDGEYLRGTIAGPRIENALALSRNLLHKKASIYTFKDSILVESSLEILHQSPERVIVRGLQDGELIPQKPIAGAYVGMPVKIIGVQQ